MSAVCMDKFQFAQELQHRKEKYYRIAYSYVKNEENALDIVAEATYKALKNLRTLQRGSSFDTWMTRIVVNTAIDFHRKHARMLATEDEVLEILAVSEADLAIEDSMDLYRALDALGARDRICVTLRYFEEQPFAQIAEILNESEPAVKSRLYRALRKMRIFLEKGVQNV